MTVTACDAVARWLGEMTTAELRAVLIRLVGHCDRAAVRWPDLARIIDADRAAVLALFDALEEVERQQSRDDGGRCVVPLVAGGQLVVHAADRPDRGLTYLEIVGAVAPDADGVATLAESERRKLAAILARGTPIEEGAG